MDIFKFTNPTHPTLLEQGDLVNGLKTILWIERYRDICDFEFTTFADKMVHEQLPVGTLISHTESDEVMVVENHEIVEDLGKETEIKITGRSFESFFENRIVGSNREWPTVASATEDYVLPPGLTWDQAVLLLKDHVDSTLVVDPDDALLNVVIMSDIFGTGEEIERIVQRGDLYSRLIELLNVDNLGIKTIRPGPRSPLGISDPNMAVVIHKGQDLSTDVVFSYNTGEILSADYLKSNKTYKNAALVTGRWLETIVKNDSAGYDRRMMYIDASDIDSAFSSAPTGIDETNVLAAMYIRGLTALAAQKQISLVKTEPTRNSSVYKYREHYNVGDLVMVDGAYSDDSVMRISEYVEIEDENGNSGYPTLSAI